MLNTLKMRQYATVRDFSMSMNQQKFKLPPRKWYSLEQAIEKIYKLTGERITIEDIY